MGTIDKVSAAVSEWTFNVAASILPKVGIPPESAIGKFMYGFLGVNPASYNLWNELGFLAEPTIQVMISPLINQYLGGLPEEQVKEVAKKYVDAMMAEVERKGSINLFGLSLRKDAIEDLQRIVNEKIGE
jgi:hypothetical protein